MPYRPTFAADFGIDRTMNIFRTIRNDVIRRNESWDIFIAQKRGAGKSAIATRLAMMIDPNFSMKNVCFTVSKFVGLLTSRLQPGTVLVFDDLGTQGGGSSRKWQKKESQDLADIMQLNRTDGIITIATSLELERGEKRLRAGFALMADPGTKLSNADTGGHGLASRIILRKKITDVFEGSTHWQYWRYAAGGRIVAIDISHPPTAFWTGEYKQERDSFLDDIKENRKDGIEAERSPSGDTHKIDREISVMLGTRPNRVFMYRDVLQELYDAGATSKSTAMPATTVHEIIMRTFSYQQKRSCERVTTKSLTAKFVKSYKYPSASKDATRRGGVIWLTEQGIKFVLREPL